MKVLVTGGAGFIGSHIVDAYVGLGHEVTVVDNLSTGRRTNLNPRARFHHIDIGDASHLDQVFAEGAFDAVNHQAAQIDVRRSVADPVDDARINLLGMLTLMECCARYRVSQCIFASSGGAIYGEQDYFPADERHPCRPISPYGIAKLSTEHYLHYYDVVHGIPSVRLRYANVYGPRQNPEGEAGVVAIFLSKMLKGEQPVINGEGGQTRDYVYAGDVVRANVLALGQRTSGVFNVGTGHETDVNTIFRLLRTLTGSQAREQHGEAKKGEQMRSVLDSAHAKQVLGWSPLISLEDGLRETVTYFRNVASSDGLRAD